MNHPDTLVIGAGAAGLTAACFCSGSTLLVDRMKSPGLKLLVTGGGRCNLTHQSDPDGIMKHFGRNARFMAPALYNFPPDQICEFFQKNGVETLVQPDGCVFPRSQKAADVLHALVGKAKSNGSHLQTSTTVERLIIEPMDDAKGHVTKVITSAGEICPKRVILAAGGMSYSALGSNGSGFKLAQQAGLKVTPPLPALAGLKTVESWPAGVTGIVLENAAIRLAEKGASKKWFEGELLFTHQGLSAPPALALSGEIACLLSQRVDGPDASVSVEVNMDCSRSAEQWLELFDGWRRQTGGRAVHNLLSGELPRSLAQILCREAALEESAIARSPKDKLIHLSKLLTTCPLKIKAVDGWSKAMVTRGGVDVQELDPQTMACRGIPNLYCVGEVVDLDGACGGYNLTWAFASAVLAGESCS
ncbi:MAG: aminoacetone oxidase family FAD-binding enzyme [Kiritimatiellae bacterium]|jgi:predicted Rossmann fold flavoprotein|nr:aminoacetone oxidase family FAD-binding enzyme [Kiritimatiellia bacterium]